MDLFTLEFKRLKAKNPSPDFSSVVDLHDFEKNAFIHKLSLKAPNKKQILGLKPCIDWHVFTFDHYPGFTVIQNPFVDGYQKYWVSRCLQDFPSDRTNVTNLSALGDLDSFNLWHKFSSLKRSSLSKDEPLTKLRWTTLGYHYDWNTKEYSEGRKADFPLDIQYLTQYFADCLKLGPYEAEAAIVNYYHLDSTLAGHTDHSELDHNAPLFSISFGQSAVFMLGGLTKAEKPMSLFLRSGDVCIMSGPCRLAYHAVPKILSPNNGFTDLSCFDLKAVNNCDTDTERSDKQAQSFMEQCPANFTESLKRTSDDQGTIAPSKLSRTQSANAADMKNNEPCCAATSDSQTSFIDTLNKNISDTLLKIDWNPFKVYLDSSRINLNVRQVFTVDNNIVQSDSLHNTQS